MSLADSSSRFAAIKFLSLVIELISPHFAQGSITSKCIFIGPMMPLTHRHLARHFVLIPLNHDSTILITGQKKMFGFSWNSTKANSLRELTHGFLFLPDSFILFHACDPWLFNDCTLWRRRLRFVSRSFCLFDDCIGRHC